MQSRRDRSTLARGRTPSVLVVGAGPTGLTAALVLAANGVRARIVDRRPGPSPTSRALGVQARSMELLAPLGIADEIAGMGYRLSGSSILRGATELARQRWVPPDSPYPYTYVLPQSGVERVLRRRLAEHGVEVDWDTELVSLGQGGRGVTARTGTGETIETAWLVGADGAHSRVRAAVGIDFVGRDTAEVHHLADAVLRDAPPVEDAAMWLGPQGPLMLMRLPGPGNLWRVFADITDASGDAREAEPTVASLQALLDGRGLGPGRLRVESLAWTSVFRTRLRLAAAYRSRRVLIAGDAAHVFPPYGGQGMNLGIQDAYDLGWKLARVIRGDAPEGLLDSYEADRRPVASATIREVDARRRVFAIRNPLGRVLRDRALRLLARNEAGMRAASRQNSQIDTSYRMRRALGPRPGVGDRAPDAVLGRETVHSLLGPDHDTLLRFDPRPSSGPTVSTTDDGLVTVRVNPETDPDGSVASRYRMRDGVVLIRPDGYIAYRGAAAQLASARSALGGETYDLVL